MTPSNASQSTQHEKFAWLHSTFMFLRSEHVRVQRFLILRIFYLSWTKWSWKYWTIPREFSVVLRHRSIEQLWFSEFKKKDHHHKNSQCSEPILIPTPSPHPNNRVSRFSLFGILLVWWFKNFQLMKRIALVCWLYCRSIISKKTSSY
jgi:hypothetical protein